MLWTEVEVKGWGGLCLVSLLFIELKHFVAVYFPLIPTNFFFFFFFQGTWRLDKNKKGEKYGISECIKLYAFWILCARLNCEREECVKSAVKVSWFPFHIAPFWYKHPRMVRARSCTCECKSKFEGVGVLLNWGLLICLLKHIKSSWKTSQVYHLFCWNNVLYQFIHLFSHYPHIYTIIIV